MKIVCAPDSFKGSIDSPAAAAAMAAGIVAAFPGSLVDCCPVGDGGEGTLAALLGALDGESSQQRVSGSDGAPVDAAYGRFARQGFSYVEAAAAIGLHPDEAKRDVMHASSYGVGQLLMAACAEETGRILVGLGGTATNDGGCGMAQALGVRFLDTSGRQIETALTGAMLTRISRIDTSTAAKALGKVEITALCDVTNPLTGPNGAAVVYAPQKGASEADVEALDAGLAHLADIIARDLGIEVDRMSGAGAAGGLGAGLHAFAGARIASGIETVLDAVGFDERLAGAALCITGEGRLDGQSMSGKACMGIAARAAARGVPTVALVGGVGPGASDCLDAGLAGIVVIGEGRSTAASMREAQPLLSAAAARAARQYCGNGDTIENRPLGTGR